MDEVLSIGESILVLGCMGLAGLFILTWEVVSIKRLFPPSPPKNRKRKYLVEYTSGGFNDQVIAVHAEIMEFTDEEFNKAISIYPLKSITLLT